MKSIVFFCLFAVLVALSEAQCRNGERTRIDCNNCRCVGSVWACTRRLCAPGELRGKRDTAPLPYTRRSSRGVPIGADLKNTPCAPNDQFTIECNQCFCNAERTGYVCTEKVCQATSPKPNGTETSTEANNLPNAFNGQVRSLDSHAHSTNGEINGQGQHIELETHPKANGRQQRNGESIPSDSQKHQSQDDEDSSIDNQSPRSTI